MREDVYDKLKEWIINLHYRPGDLLTETNLAAELNVSRTPIREALIRLAHEDLVIMSPHSIARVSDVNLTDFQKLIEIRLILERGAARLSARNATAKQIREFEKLRDKAKLLQKDDEYGIKNCDVKFHELMRLCTHNEMVDKHLSMVQNHFLRIGFLIPTQYTGLLPDLDAVPDVLRSKDETAMEKLIEYHVENFIQMVRDHFKIV
jgi:DNA-binding GntR family transcriptional regulator